MRALIGGVVTCGCAVAVAVKVPQLIEQSQSVIEGPGRTPVTDFTLLTVRWWWFVPLAMLGWLLYSGRQREPDDTFFKVYYAAFALVMAVMMILLIGGLLLPLFGAMPTPGGL
jgi:hypothetical protein